jgi:hypothetical protein
MEMIPSLALTLFGTWMATRGSRVIAIVCWVLALVAMLGVMSYHMSDPLKIDL